MSELNFDVLHLICGLLTNVPDVLSFSLTCSTLHPVAVERRLSMRTITINSAKSIRDFHDFIFVDEKQRGQHIRALTIPVYDESTKGSLEDLVNRLVAVFKSARRLRTVSLYVPGPQSLFSHPRFLAAVARMAGIQEFNLVAPLGSARQLLFNGCSTLRTFRYSETCGSYQGSLELMRISPCLRTAIEEIELSLEFLGLAGHSGVSFPAVRSFALTGVYNVLQLDMLLAVFPNLDRAFIMNIDAGLLYAHDHLATIREENRKRASVQKMLPWKALDRVAADPDILYSLGLECPIRHLTLGMRWNDNHVSRAPAGNVRAVLCEHAPTHLALVGIGLPHGFSNFDDILYPEDAVVGMTHLVLDATYRNTDSTPYDSVHGVYETTKSSWDAMLDALQDGLEGLHLTHIRIVIRCEVNLEYAFCAPIYDGAHSFTFNRLLTALPRTIPSLTHIFITSAGCAYKDVDAGCRQVVQDRWETCSAWQVRRLARHGGGGPSRRGTHVLEELNAEEAEAVIDTEEMHATENMNWVMRQDWADRGSDDHPLGW